MSWQDDLRQLDQALAEGRIPADEYRQRRDQLHAAAAGGSAQPPADQPAQAPPVQPHGMQSQPGPAGPPQDQGQQQPPQQGQGQQGQGQGQQGSGPFAPPFQWNSNAEATQVVSANQQQGGGDNPEATQIVNPRAIESESTQTLRPVGPPPQMQQPQHPHHQQPAPWHSARPVEPPPWGGDNDGPLAAPNPTWLAQGPEVFESDSGGGKGGKIAIIAVVAVLVVGLGVGGYFFFTSGKDNPTPPANQTSQAAPPTSTSPPKPKDDLSVADLPGTLEDHSDVTTFDQAQPKNFLTQEELSLFETAGPGKARLTSSVLSNGVRAFIFTTEVSSENTAETAVDALAQQQIKYGMTKSSGAPTGVQVAEVDKNGATPAMIRAHYVHKKTVVRIQVYGSTLADVRTTFDEVLEAQLKILAANG